MARRRLKLTLNRFVGNIRGPAGPSGAVVALSHAENFLAAEIGRAHRPWRGGVGSRTGGQGKRAYYVGLQWVNCQPQGRLVHFM